MHWMAQISPITVISQVCTRPPVLTWKIRIWPMTWYLATSWGARITCNCTRPPVEQPDHWRRLILAPKPSSALWYNTPSQPPSLHYTGTKLSNLTQYITATRLNTRSSTQLLPILDPGHTTQDVLLYFSFAQHCCFTLVRCRREGIELQSCD